MVYIKKASGKSAGSFCAVAPVVCIVTGISCNELFYSDGDLFIDAVLCIYPDLAGSAAYCFDLAGLCHGCNLCIAGLVSELSMLHDRFILLSLYLGSLDINAFADGQSDFFGLLDPADLVDLNGLRYAL